MANAKKKPAPKAVKKSTSKPKSAPVKPKKTVSKPKPVKKVAAKPVKKTVAKPVQPKPAPVKPAPAKPAPSKRTSSRPTSRSRKSATAKAERPARPDAKPSLQSLQLVNFPIVNQRPIAHKPAKATAVDDRTRYSEEELKEFEVMIQAKLAKAREEFKILRDTLTRNNDEGTDSTSGGNTKVLEDGAETAEKENLGQQAARQQKFITNLENALVRIKNGTYGICSVTGKLISKERLIAVPHTTQSIEAKMMKKD